MKTETCTPTKQAGHTAGPWTAVAEKVGAQKRLRAFRVYDPSGRAVARMHDCQPEGECEANARLIAAAPELLEACRALLAHLPYGNEALQIKAEAAIAKATGS